MYFFRPRFRSGAVRLSFRVARLKPEPALLVVVVDVVLAPPMLA